jgi:hypothetical protein
MYFPTLYTLVFWEAFTEFGPKPINPLTKKHPRP